MSQLKEHFDPTALVTETSTRHNLGAERVVNPAMRVKTF
jgi:hypothetical protein